LYESVLPVIRCIFPARWRASHSLLARSPDLSFTAQRRDAHCAAKHHG
jgi:hypothetical protein